MKHKSLLTFTFCSLLLAGCASSSPSGLGRAGALEPEAIQQGNAQDTAGKYVITFHSMNGSAVAPVYVTPNTKATAPTNPSRAGYDFKGWSKDPYGITPWSFDTVITSDWKLYAMWERNSSGGDDPSQSIEYTINGLPTWTKNDGCVVFAWAWLPGESGDWYALEYTSDTSAKFNAPGALEGFLMARCAKDTTTPDWSKSTDGPGRVYNQTDNIPCRDGVTAYECPAFREYHP